jgi:hypothetical protein
VWLALAAVAAAALGGYVPVKEDVEKAAAKGDAAAVVGDGYRWGGRPDAQRGWWYQ